MSHDHPFISQIDRALGAHGAWKLKLKTAIATQSTKLDPQDVRCDHCCDFGTWLHGPAIDLETRRGLPYRTIKRLHAEFHEAAGNVAQLTIDGRTREANDLLQGDFAGRSDKLGRALSLWKRELQAS